MSMGNLKQTQEQKLKLSIKQVLHANLLQLNAQLLEQRILKEISDNPVLELSEQEDAFEDIKEADDKTSDKSWDSINWDHWVEGESAISYVRCIRNLNWHK